MIDPADAAVLGNQIVLIIAAIGSLIGVITNLIITWRTKTVVQEVQHEVNSKNTALNAKVTELHDTLVANNVDVPNNPITTKE